MHKSPRHCTVDELVRRIGMPTTPRMDRDAALDELAGRTGLTLDERAARDRTLKAAGR